MYPGHVGCWGSRMNGSAHIERGLEERIDKHIEHHSARV
jgi:hypothetical protein